jgi:hypothetical protein
VEVATRQVRWVCGDKVLFHGVTHWAPLPGKPRK